MVDNKYVGSLPRTGWEPCWNIYDWYGWGVDGVGWESRRGGSSGNVFFLLAFGTPFYFFCRINLNEEQCLV